LPATGIADDATLNALERRFFVNRIVSFLKSLFVQR